MDNAGFSSISVVIPTHFRPGTLKRAIDSALVQTHAVAELIIVSDGFNQQTDDLMNALIKDNDRIKYLILNPARGGNYARNLGIKNAVSDWVAFLDDDDEWHPEKLERQMRVARSDPAIGLVCSAYLSVFVDDNKAIEFVPSARLDNSHDILLTNNIGSTTSVVVKRDILHQAGLFDENLKAMQDYELWIRLCQLTKVGVVKEPSINYFNDSGVAQISNNTQKYIAASEHIASKYKDLFESKLSPAENRQREAAIKVVISKKGLRNNEPFIARKYALEALKLGLFFRGMACYAASFVPYSILIFLRSKKK